MLVMIAKEIQMLTVFLWGTCIKDKLLVISLFDAGRATLRPYSTHLCLEHVRLCDSFVNVF